VDDDRQAVLTEVIVQFDEIRTRRQREPEGRQGVFRRLQAAPRWAITRGDGPAMRCMAGRTSEAAPRETDTNGMIAIPRSDMPTRRPQSRPVVIVSVCVMVPSA
jgi:hypothetical protein